MTQEPGQLRLLTINRLLRYARKDTVRCKISGMNLNELFAVSPAKVALLKGKMAHLKIDPVLIEEKFVKGSGRGGQKINKTANAVQLAYPPLDIHVKVQRERQRNVNRFLALRELVDQIEMRVSPETSPRLKEWEKIRKQKDRKRRKQERKELTGPLSDKGGDRGGTQT